MRSTFRVFCYIDRQKGPGGRHDGRLVPVEYRRQACRADNGHLLPARDVGSPPREILSPRENNHLEAFCQRVVRTYEQMLEKQAW